MITTMKKNNRSKNRVLYSARRPSAAVYSSALEKYSIHDIVKQQERQEMIILVASKTVSPSSYSNTSRTMYFLRMVSILCW